MSALILLSNDDGVRAPGLLALRQALEGLGEIWVVAPDRPRSASGHSITLDEPVRLRESSLLDGSFAYEVSGVPADCVALAINKLLPRTPDLVVTGINHGPNLGWDVSYSGTVSGALEGAVAGAKAAAISITSWKPHEDLQYAREYARGLAQQLLENGLPEDVALNVNIPAGRHPEGVLLTRQGRRRYVAKVREQTDPRGRLYYWIDGDLADDPHLEGTDTWAVANGYISVTPIHLDLTNHEASGRLEWLAKTEARSV